MLAFHGFGQTHAHFKPLSLQLEESYTLYSFDLFYHGQSFWAHKDTPLAKRLWNDMLEAFLAQQQITEFAVMGFSMGGKFVLATIEAFAASITEIILIAPDGVKTSLWYSLATYPSWTKKLFQRLIVKPGLFQQVVGWLRKVRLVDKGIARFAESQMNTRQKRHQVYYSWMVFRKLTFDLSHIASLVNRYQIPFTMFLGRYDKIITPQNMQRLLKKIPHHQMIILNTGHTRLIEAVAEYYMSEP